MCKIPTDNKLLSNENVKRGAEKFVAQLFSVEA